MNYVCISGIFAGHKFNGTPISINGEERIWDNNSIGRSYPANNCKIVIDN